MLLFGFVFNYRKIVYDVYVENIDRYEGNVVTIPRSNSLDTEESIGKNIEIKNIQSDSKENIYTYKVIIKDVVGVVKYSIDGIYDYIVFNADNEANFELKSNESLIIYGIKINSNYEIEQVINSGYNTYVDNINTNKYMGNVSNSNVIIFNNINEIVSENPNTVDKLFICLGIVIFFVILLITLRFVRITKYKKVD